MEYDCDIMNESSSSSSLSSTDNFLNYFKMQQPQLQQQQQLQQQHQNKYQQNQNQNLAQNQFSSSSSSSSPGNSALTSSVNLHQMLLNDQQQSLQQTFTSSASSTQTITPSSMPNSCSLIFSTAASFNINQNDAVMYARESIHLLAKFLATYGENTLFRSLYAYAPDNLAWLWAFFDWDTPIDLSQVPVQDAYKPFVWTDDDPSSAQFVTLSEDELNKINKVFADSPLFQYKYRESLMIGDLFKFFEHVQKTTLSLVAKSLFVLYFPRFSAFVDNPLKKYLSPKILSANLPLIKELDLMITRLIKSRYSNLNEYKHKILTSSHNLPSYVRNLLSEACLWSSSQSSNRLLLASLTSGLNNKTIMHPTNSNSNSNSKYYSYESNVPDINNNNKLLCNSGLDLLTSKLLAAAAVASNNGKSDVSSTTTSATSTSAATASNGTEEKYILQTLSYLKMLEKSNKINNDLDHISFDQSILLDNTTAPLATLDETGSDEGELVSILKATTSTTTTTDSKQQQSSFQVHQQQRSAMPYMNMNEISSPLIGAADTATNSSSSSYFINMANSQRLGGVSCMSPAASAAAQLQIQVQNNANRLLMNTPQTPSNINPYLMSMPAADAEHPTSNCIWSSGRMINAGGGGGGGGGGTGRNSFSSSVTPPPSATLHKANQLSLLNANGDIYDEWSSSSPGNTLDQLLLGGSNTNGGISSGEEQFARYFRQSAYITSPIPKSSAPKHAWSKINCDYDMYSNNSGNNNNIGVLKPVGTSRISREMRAAAAFNEGGGSEFNEFNCNVPLNVNTNIHSNLNSMRSPMMKSPYASNKSSNYFNSGNANTNVQNINQHTWCGRLPPKIYPLNTIYSRKVFLGGLPWDVNQQLLVQLLSKYGSSVKLEVPGKDLKHPRVSSICKSQERSTPGYVYIIFDQEAAVQRLLAECRKEFKNGGEHYFYTIHIPPQAAQPCNNQHQGGAPMSPPQHHQHHHYQSFGNGQMSKRGTGAGGGKSKEVEVIPWNQEDTSYVPQCKNSVLPAKIDTRSTIFVGGLHGMLNAHGLGKVMNEIFGDVIHAGLDTDKYKYPIGSGRVTFRDRASYVKAIKSRFVTIKANMDPCDPSPKFEKTIQIDPYLEDAKCSKCDQKAANFCRNEICLDYYCIHCWTFRHDTKTNGEHLHISRNKPNHG